MNKAKIWLLACGLCLACLTASAQTYPAKVVKMVVPNAPGGPSDVVGRLLAQKFTEAWGVPVIVDNKPGAGGNIGASTVAKSTPDGYTLLVTNSAPISINKSLYTKMSFDPETELAPISLVASSPLLLLVPPNSRYRSVADLVAAAKAEPGRLSYGSIGTGTAPHLAAEMFRSHAGVDLLHVPYSTVPQALMAVMNGEVSMIFLTTDSSLAVATSGRAQALAVTSRARSPVLPSVPTLVESGLRDYEVLGWYGIFAPAGTSQEILSRVNAETRQALAQPDIKQKLNAIGFEIVGNAPADFTTFIATESDRWARLLEAAKVRLD
ncbi:MAG: Bug family tripartite tricarboxylate transporter substrate binding protein [Lautropia sp.]